LDDRLTSIRLWPDRFGWSDGLPCLSRWSELVGDRRGYDGAKKVSGSKRHIAVDCLGLLLVVMVTAADLQDRDAGVNLLAMVCELFTWVRMVWADSGYAGALVDWAPAQARSELAVFQPSSVRW
jgi:hypothetical protein